MSEPVKVFEEGSLKAKIWKNETEKDGEKRTWYSVTADRSYKDSEDKWQSTNSFSAREAAIMASLLLQAHAYLVSIRGGD